MIRALYRLLCNLAGVLFRLLVKEPLFLLLGIPFYIFLVWVVGALIAFPLLVFGYLGEVSSFSDLKRLLLEIFDFLFKQPFRVTSGDVRDQDFGATVVQFLCLGYSWYVVTPRLFSSTPRAYIKKLAAGISRTKPSSLFSFATQSKWQRIVIHNPFQGIYIEGSAGSGKSKSVIEPIIHQAVSQGYAGFLYDFKGNPPTLSSCLHGAIAKSKVRTQFAHINLSSPAISNRCNPLSPNYFPHKYYAHEYASVILKNLNKEWASKIDFWAENAIAYLAAILWHLRKYHPQLCSLPHATLLAMEAPEKSLSLLNSDEETKRMVSAISTAYDNNAEKQIAGIFSSLQLSMSKLYTREIFWILSSNPGDVGHVTLDVSDPTYRQLLSVANDPILSDVFSPIVALIAMVCIKNMNQQGKHPSVFILDEAPTLFIPGLANLPATARSNKVVSVIAVQDLTQLKTVYGNKAAETIRNNLGNQFFGMTNNLGTAEYVSKMAGFYNQMKTSVSDSSGTHGSSSSETASLHKEPYVDAHQVASQPSGHFITKVTGKKPRFFATQLKAHRSHMKPPDKVVPDTRLATLIDDQWQSIHQDVKTILALKTRN